MSEKNIVEKTTMTTGEIIDMKLKAYERGQLDALLAIDMPYDSISFLLKIPIDEVIDHHREFLSFKNSH